MSSMILLHFCQMLLDHGCCTDGRDSCGYSLLDMAVVSGSRSCVEMLIQHGMHPDTRGTKGCTALTTGIACNVFYDTPRQSISQWVEWKENASNISSLRFCAYK